MCSRKGRERGGGEFDLICWVGVVGVGEERMGEAGGGERFRGKGRGDPEGSVSTFHVDTFLGE